MTTPKERLSHLLELAASGAGERTALAGEVADLLLDWPAQYSAAMRGTFAALLEKIVREIDAPSRAALAARFEGRADFPPALLNEFFFCASPAMKDAILACNDAAEPLPAPPVDSDGLLKAARTTGDFMPALAEAAQVPAALALACLRDPQALAVLVKGAGVNRATFSAIAILTGPARSVRENFAMLELFDRVPQNGARQLVAFWRAHGETMPVERAA
ncbi:MAG: hypothetical protein WDM81_13480 [Rhizomicrobium sp.]